MTRTAIITGASAGLGFECTRALLAADPSWHIVCAVRDIAKGEAAVAELGAAQRCTVVECDLASLSSVRTFVDTVTGAIGAGELPPLHAIVCNAGLQTTTPQWTPDGVEMTFGVNHLGHFALVTGLLERVSAPARIVVVASGTHDPKKFTGMPHPRYTQAVDIAHPAEDVSGRVRYTTSKLCNVLFAYELDRQLDHGRRGITVTAFDPGLMPSTDLSRDYSPMQKVLWRTISPLLRVLPNVHSTATSGARLARLVHDPALEGVTGTYFEGATPIRSSAESYDEAKARDLWETSQRLIAPALA